VIWLSDPKKLVCDLETQLETDDIGRHIIMMGFYYLLNRSGKYTEIAAG
jgi:hypothetical protein